MPRGKPPPPRPRQRSKDDLSRADTAATTTSIEPDREQLPSRRRGEPVAIPTQELLGKAKHDWGKIGVWVTIGTFLAGALGTAIWSYADTVAGLKGLSEDVKALKNRADELFKSSVETAARVGTLERKSQEAAPQASPAASTPRSATGSGR